MSMLRLCATGLSASLLLSACSQPDQPLVAMCQNVTQNLLGGPVSSWNKTEQVRVNDDRIQVNLSFPTGVSSCEYGRSTVGPRDESGNRRMAGAPSRVTLNGQEISSGDLMTAVAKSSGKLIKESAEATSAAAKEFAANADDNLRNMADQAGQAMSQAGEKAREAALKATEAVQDKLQK